MARPAWGSRGSPDPRLIPGTAGQRGPEHSQAPTVGTPCPRQPGSRGRLISAWAGESPLPGARPEPQPHHCPDLWAAPDLHSCSLSPSWLPRPQPFLDSLLPLWSPPRPDAQLGAGCSQAPRLDVPSSLRPALPSALCTGPPTAAPGPQTRGGLIQGQPTPQRRTVSERPEAWPKPHQPRRCSVHRGRGWAGVG